MEEVAEMDQAEFIATLGTLFEIENPKFDIYKDFIKREDYFKGYEEERVAYFKRKAKEKSSKSKVDKEKENDEDE